VTDPIERWRVLASGTVQGVGFRPFVYRLAHDEALLGEVSNEGLGASLEIQGPTSALERFVARLRVELPHPGDVERLDVEAMPLDHQARAFVIAPSSEAVGRRLSLAPDLATCAACLAELRDPEDRRYRYPFINCTHCGPRYTITSALPYDRPKTTMAVFPMCANCRSEYDDPLNRRYHAQPIACPECGPAIWCVEAARLNDASALEPPKLAPGDWLRHTEHALQAAQRVLESGGILAVKGLGGFHLAVDARNPDAIARLRQRKHRPTKGLAVMVANLEVARGFGQLDPSAIQSLASSAAPIVLVPKAAGVDPGLAPVSNDIGLMLPYTPLHSMLLEGTLDALVMTSGNRSAEPIATENRVAALELGADAVLLHNREIRVGCDDSVLRWSESGPSLIRRARGFVPSALRAEMLPNRSILALGAHLKVTLATLCRGELAVGRHLGDLDNPAAEDAYLDEIERMLRFGQVEPEAVAVDLHPDLFSTHVAQERFAELPIVRVQHHHAHLASVMVEHGLGLDRRVAGIVLDGLGFGEDGTIWGGEVLVGGYERVERVGHLRPIAQPGGDRAALEPFRMATSLLLAAGLGPEHWRFFDEELAAITALRLVSPLTSSVGRLFDGVAALLGVAPRRQTFEGEAAMALERVADERCSSAYSFPVEAGVIEVREMVQELLRDPDDVSLRAARFHNGLADAFVEVACAAGADVVVLSGGAMVNRLLSRRLGTQLQARGVEAFWPRRLPAGDGGLSAGQAAIASVRLST